MHKASCSLFPIFPNNINYQQLHFRINVNPTRGNDKCRNAFIHSFGTNKLGSVGHQKAEEEALLFWY